MGIKNSLIKDFNMGKVAPDTTSLVLKLFKTHGLTDCHPLESHPGWIVESQNSMRLIKKCFEPIYFTTMPALRKFSWTEPGHSIRVAVVPPSEMLLYAHAVVDLAKSFGHVPEGLFTYFHMSPLMASDDVGRNCQGTPHVVVLRHGSMNFRAVVKLHRRLRKRKRSQAVGAILFLLTRWKEALPSGCWQTRLLEEVVWKEFLDRKILQACTFYNRFRMVRSFNSVVLFSEAGELETCSLTEGTFASLVGLVLRTCRLNQIMVDYEGPDTLETYPWIDSLPPWTRLINAVASRGIFPCPWSLDWDVHTFAQEVWTRNRTYKEDLISALTWAQEGDVSAWLRVRQGTPGYPLARAWVKSLATLAKEAPWSSWLRPETAEEILKNLS